MLYKAVGIDNEGKMWSSFSPFRVEYRIGQTIEPNVADTMLYVVNEEWRGLYLGDAIQSYDYAAVLEVKTDVLYAPEVHYTDDVLQLRDYFWGRKFPRPDKDEWQYMTRWVHPVKIHSVHRLVVRSLPSGIRRTHTEIGPNWLPENIQEVLYGSL